MFNFKKKPKLVTHNNRFHADDVFATATLLIMLGKEIKDVEIIRTRDKKIIDSADYVYDTGLIYDPEKNRFDHHQEEGGGKRDNGVPYSSFGLVWKKFGFEICGSEKVAQKIDKKLAQPIDAMDNGVEIYQTIYPDLHPYMLMDIIFAFDPSWPEKENFDNGFINAVSLVKKLLEREIIKAKSFEKVEGVLFDIYSEAKDKRIIVLEENYPWENILNKYPEPLFVVKPRSSGQWSVKSVRDDIYSFENRKSFPESWAGKVDSELAEITGVKDAVFCHNKRFICAAGSKEGAIRLAELALENSD